MEDRLEQFKCPHCGAGIEFSGETQEMKCDFCGAEISVDEIIEYLDAETDAKQRVSGWNKGEGQHFDGESDLNVFSCPSCGGEIVCEATTVATACPYCDNPVIMKGRVSGDLMPDCVIPFRITKEQAKDALRRHYKNKTLLPKVFADENHIDEVKGIYVPFWLFDGDADVSIRYEGIRTRVWRDSEYENTARSHYLILRSGGLGFDNVPVDGSKKMENNLIESIEPFDFSEAVDFKTAYLSGFFADRYDESSDDCISRAEQRMENTAEDQIRNTVVGYDSVTVKKKAVFVHNGRVRYALCPVWILNTKWKDRSYRFIVNGQNGRIAGDLPMSKSLYRKWFAGIFAAGTAIITLLTLLIRFLGAK